MSKLILFRVHFLVEAPKQLLLREWFDELLNIGLIGDEVNERVMAELGLGL